MMIRKRILRPLNQISKNVKRRIAQTLFSFEKVPIIFGNAVPKCGSHLLYQILQGVCTIGPFMETGRGPIRRITQHERRVRSTKEILYDLQMLRPGDVAWGYLHPDPEVVNFLCRGGIVNYFIIRDPRDMVVSQVFYATTMHLGHAMHDYYTSLNNIDNCLKVEIQGISYNGLSLPDIGTRYERIKGWFKQPSVMVIRFEDLISNRGQVINQMLDHLESSGFKLRISRQLAVSRVIAAIQPHKSSTFRKGIVGDWRNYFKEEHKKIFKENAGDVLIQLGYERNNDW